MLTNTDRVPLSLIHFKGFVATIWLQSLCIYDTNSGSILKSMKHTEYLRIQMSTKFSEMRTVF